MTTTMNKAQDRIAEDSLRSYYAKIKNITLLTAEEEQRTRPAYPQRATRKPEDA